MTLSLKIFTLYLLFNFSFIKDVSFWIPHDGSTRPVLILNFVWTKYSTKDIQIMIGEEVNLILHVLSTFLDSYIESCLLL